MAPKEADSPPSARHQENLITVTSKEPRKGRRSRALTDIATAAMVVTGAVLVGVAVSQHEHHDHAIAAQAASKAQVDRAAVLEAQQFGARAEPQTRKAPQSGQANVSAEVDQKLLAAAQAHGEAQQLRATAQALAANHQVGVGPAGRGPSAVRAAQSDLTAAGAVSEIGGAGATLIIPALQVHAPIVATGAVDGSMTIPADVHIVGWYDGIDTIGGRTNSAPTPWPGQPGVSLLAGHINWVGQGPGALYYIGQLVVGDPIEVIGSNREATYWRVSQPAVTILKADLPADLFVNSGPPKLALVTCGGPYDAATGHYLDNVIVWATLRRR